MNTHPNGCATHHGAPCDCTPHPRAADPTAGLIMLNHPEAEADWMRLLWERRIGPQVRTLCFRADPELGLLPCEPFTTPDGEPLLFFRDDGSRVGLAKRQPYIAPYDWAALRRLRVMPAGGNNPHPPGGAPSMLGEPTQRVCPRRGQ